MKTTKYYIVFIFAILLASCASETSSNKENEARFLETLQLHLDAVANKDISTLESTIHPNGKMQLILPKEPIKTTVEEFVTYHKEWFALDNNWTFSTKVLNYKVDKTLGMAVVEVLYKEPLRNEKPYYNRMIVSYDLEQVDGKWYFIKDHASSVEKSTDNK